MNRAAGPARRWWMVGIVVALVAIGLLVLRGRGLTARRQPLPLEERVTRGGRAFLTPAAVKAAVNPVADTPDIVRAGLEHFADHCASCHGNDGSGDTSLGRSLFPRAPDMRKGPTQAMTDGELFYAIEQGIPFTGMPAWGTGTEEGERSSWVLVRFIRHLPRISADEVRQMEGLNPKSAGDDRRLREVQEFLNRQ